LHSSATDYCTVVQRTIAQ